MKPYNLSASDFRAATVTALQLSPFVLQISTRYVHSAFVSPFVALVCSLASFLTYLGKPLATVCVECWYLLVFWGFFRVFLTAWLGSASFWIAVFDCYTSCM